MRTPEQIINDLRRVRQLNIEIYARMARMVPEVEALGWKARVPGTPDVTMLLVEQSLKRSPAEAAQAIAEVTQNDVEILRLSRELVEATYGAQRKRAVLLPGGGVLHTYAVREALALGLTPIVTDQDPDCLCAKIPGVEFHKIDCYDVNKTLDLADKVSGRLAGAFCGGADTHVVVARVAELVGSIWVSRETAETCRDKLRARTALVGAGVPTARSAFVHQLEGREIAVEGGVWKPRIGSGSRGVRRHVIGDVLPSGGHFEEPLEGPEQSVEILLYSETTWVPVNVVDRHFAWVDDQPLEWGHTNPSRLSDEAVDNLYALAFAAARAVGATVGFFKIDSILTEDGPKVLECTPRLSGGFDSQLSTPMSSGRNLLRYGLQLACGLALDKRLLERSKEERVTIIHRPELAGAADQKT
jgi:predicted ATP-grasp superfamily ATP-dependent carboligase